MAGKAANMSKSNSKAPRRRLVVFSALAGSLTVTALFLQLLSPPPVRAQAHRVLANRSPVDVVSVSAPSEARRSWKYIYIHQSTSDFADARSVIAGPEAGDHFLIANGTGAADGDVLVSSRWENQLSALPPAGAQAIDPDIVSICLVGNLDRAKPSAAQMRELGELVASLRSTYGIPANRVFTFEHAGRPGVGKQFPAGELTKILSNQ